MLLNTKLSRKSHDDNLLTESQISTIFYWIANSGPPPPHPQWSSPSSNDGVAQG